MPVWQYRFLTAKKRGLFCLYNLAIFVWLDPGQGRVHIYRTYITGITLVVCTTRIYALNVCHSWQMAVRRLE